MAWLNISAVSLEDAKMPDLQEITSKAETDRKQMVKKDRSDSIYATSEEALELLLNISLNY